MFKTDLRKDYVMSFIRFKLHFLQRSSSEKSVAVEGIDRMMEVGGIFLILLLALLSLAFFGDSVRPVPVHFDAGLHADGLFIPNPFVG